MKNESQNTSSSTDNFLRLFKAVAILGVIVWLGFFVYGNATNPDSNSPFKLGLDLAGGAQLVYEADISKIDPAEIPALMNVLRNVIEERINVFGVSEPVVYLESSSFVSDKRSERLVVELPGVTNIADAVAEIGRTPLLEFKLIDRAAAAAQEQVLALQASATGTGAQISNVQVNGELVDTMNPYTDTGLTGRYLESARLEFTNGQGGQLSNEPVVSITFNKEGSDLFAEITRSNVGEQLAIFLDGEMLSAPRINEAITGGTAVISGGFNPQEARALAQNLSFGALPVPIELVSTQTIGATLGQEVLDKGIKAAALGFGLVLIFMVFWYRLPGLIATIALLAYVVIIMALFQFIPVVLTAAGLAGFVLSLGMAVDANVLVFERFKEEIRLGKDSRQAINTGFSRAWGAIRDGNITSLLSAIILFWFGTSVVKGFALVFGIGILVSMFSALVISRMLLLSLPSFTKEKNKVLNFLLGSGFQK